jgi:hypothetical protein
MRDHGSHDATIDTRLERLAESSDAVPCWYDGWQRLHAGSSDEERLRVYQAIRDARSLPEEAEFYLIASQIDAIVSRRAEATLKTLADDMTAIERAHGLSTDEMWLPGEAPAEYERVRLEYQRAYDSLYLEQLDACDEHQMAVLFETDRPRFDRINEAGRQYFHGAAARQETELPEWLDDFVEAVAGHMLADETMGPLGVLYREEDNFWEVMLYPSPVEMIGGAEDGAVVHPGFSLDLEGLRAMFDRVDDSGFNTHGGCGSLGPCLWLEGEYRGREIVLRILTAAPSHDHDDENHDSSVD